MLDAKLRRSISASTNAEINPIVIQLEEFGYSNIYSRRVFYYLHPEDLNEALNYMSIENNIIQHRFVKDRNPLNKLCYICGENEENHLKDFNNINNNLEKIEEDNKNKGTNSIQNNDKKNEENNNNNSIIIVHQNNNNNIKNNLDTNTNINNSISSLEYSNIKENKDDKKSNLLVENSFNNNRVLISSFNENLDIVNNKNELITEEIKEECQICNELFIVNSKK